MARARGRAIRRASEIFSHALRRGLVVLLNKNEIGAPEARDFNKFHKEIKGLTRAPGDFVGRHVGRFSCEKRMRRRALNWWDGDSEATRA